MVSLTELMPYESKLYIAQTVAFYAAVKDAIRNNNSDAIELLLLTSRGVRAMSPLAETLDLLQLASGLRKIFREYAHIDQIEVAVAVFNEEDDEGGRQLFSVCPTYYDVSGDNIGELILQEAGIPESTFNKFVVWGSKEFFDCAQGDTTYTYTRAMVEKYPTLMGLVASLSTTGIEHCDWQWSISDGDHGIQSGLAQRQQSMEANSRGSLAARNAGPKLDQAAAATPLKPDTVGYIEALLNEGGTVTIGPIGESPCAATAADAGNTVAMLVGRRGESLHALLRRLDTAIGE